MHDTPRYEALEESDFFADKRAMRPIPEGTVARGNLREDDVYYTGKRDGEIVQELPAQVKVDKALLDRGQQRFNIYCAPCHSPLGDGNGTVVQRGYKRPASYHDPRLREHGHRVLLRRDHATASARCRTTRRRWRPPIAGRSPPTSACCSAARRGTIEDVPADHRGELDGKAPAAEASHGGGAAHD